MPATVACFDEAPLKDSLVIVAFPTTGGAAPIAAHYLTRHLHLPLVGHVRMPEMDQVMAIEEGQATSVIRVYGGEVQCDLDHGCPRIYLVTTEIQVPPAMLMEVADAILAWAKEGEAHLVLALEGLVRDEDDDTPDVFVASSDPEALKELEKAGTPKAARGLVGGISARLLLAGREKGVKAAALLVEATKDHPDGRAAAALIQALDSFLPQVKVDPQPLLDEAMGLEEEIRKATKPAQAFVQDRPPGMFV